MAQLKLNNQSAERATIRISIPFKVAMDGDLLKKSLTELAENIGHRTCFSGVDCMFHLQRDFVIDEKLAVKNLADGDPDGSPARKLEKFLDIPDLVTARLSSKEMMTIDSIYKISDEITSLRGGCPACHSGFDFTFKTEIEQMRTFSATRQ